MKCPNCGFTSFDNLDKCKKCGMSFTHPKGSRDMQNEIDGKDDQNNLITDSCRPANIDNVFESIKRDLEEIDKSSHATCSSSFPSAFINKNQIFKYKGFFVRLIAYSIDSIILSLISAILFIAAYYTISSFSVDDSETIIIQSFYKPFLILILFIELFYFTYFHSETGQTPGKRVCGIKVIALDGKPLSIKRSLLRYFAYFISCFFLCAGFLWIAFDRKKQGWHDKIAKSYVVSI